MRAIHSIWWVADGLETHIKQCPDCNKKRFFGGKKICVKAKVMYADFCEAARKTSLLRKVLDISDEDVV